MPTQGQPISINDIITTVIDESGNLPTSNAVHDFVKEEINSAITGAIEGSY